MGGTSFNILDDILFTLGTGNDQAMLNRSTVLNANTALTGVLIGTPVTPALTANSLIIANITADGDILIAGNDGGHSRVALYFDSSTPDTYLYNVGGTWTAGATTWTIPAVTLGGTITLTDVAIVNLKAGTTAINPEVAHRGQFYFTEGAAGVADLLYCIMKGTDNNYSAIQVAIG